MTCIRTKALRRESDIIPTSLSNDESQLAKATGLMPANGTARTGGRESKSFWCFWKNQTF